MHQVQDFESFVTGLIFCKSISEEEESLAQNGVMVVQGGDIVKMIIFIGKSCQVDKDYFLDT